ncbi:hypothetical protein [Moorena sp. SIO3I8]|nr:hypothetical protein [Moorena sp. SIO3I8]NEO08477.1 hypothetical protein [Moorena sp. SIO3I8]
MGRWGDGEMGRWGDGEMGRWGDGDPPLTPPRRQGCFIINKIEDNQR